jgi:hypothetical protein
VVYATFGIGQKKISFDCNIFQQWNGMYATENKYQFKGPEQGDQMGRIFA